MLNLQLALKYSTAIFEIAKEENKLVPYGEELATVRNELFSVPEARSFFQNPNVLPVAKKELITKCFKGELSPIVFNFLMLLVDKRRMGIFEAIEDEYRRLSNRERGILIADVTTARPLTKGQQTKLQKKLESLSGKKIQFRLHRDEEIIGGVIVKIGDKRIDGSVRGRLEALRSQLAFGER
ncbi:MAG: ATP synthase F1 subunit delta [Selenomonadaceae bacterium]|nr:ATP synthase F1 subunit delta [Selenomonadaceae bacterium]